MLRNRLLPSGRQLEIGLLIALGFFLPLYEAPKNLVWLAYLLVWLVNRFRSREFGGAWDLWDGLIVAWMISGFVVAAFAAMHGSEWRGAFDIVRYGSVLWLVKRTRFLDQEVDWILGALIASTLVGLAMGFASLWSGTTDRLQLNSVGHVNHTAIYLAIMLTLCAAWFFTGRRKVLAGAVAILVFVSIFVAASRAGVGVSLGALLVLGFFWWPRARWPLAVSAGLVAVSLLLGLVAGAEVFEKQEANVQAGHLLAFRERVWSMALDSWLRHPWFGVGMDNFGLVTRKYEEEFYRGLFPHAHNLYLNTLAERGIVGFIPLAAVLIAWPLSLLRRRPRREDGDQHWIVWSAAAGAWLVSVVAGTVNTTLHHEEGLLASLLLGLWLSRTHRR